MNDADQLDLPTIGPEGLDKIWDDIRDMTNDQPHYMDRSGNAISMRDWVRLRHHLPNYIHIRTEDVGPYFVSTVWLGLNHSFGFGPPMIYETMVFAREISHHEETETPWGTLPAFDYHKDFDQRRYSTEEQAVAGHEAVVNEINLILAATTPSTSERTV